MSNKISLTNLSQISMRFVLDIGVLMLYKEILLDTDPHPIANIAAVLLLMEFSYPLRLKLSS